MAYSIQADIEDNLKDSTILKQIAGDGTTINATYITKLIEWADGQIDFYVGKRYTTPIPGTIPEVVKGWSITLAIHKMYLRSNRSNESAKEEAEKAYEQMESVRENEANIPGLTEVSGGVTVVQPFEDEALGEYDAAAFDMTCLETDNPDKYGVDTE